MSRHIEYDQKNQVYKHYQELDTNFYKTHSTGDLMNRITEDVSRVRMYTGPAIMYLINLVTLIGFCVVNMVRKDAMLTVICFGSVAILAITIYIVNTVIHKKSEKIQALLSDLTTNAQESYSGIRVIKSFVQEKAMLGFFNRNSEEYKKNAIGLAKVEVDLFSQYGVDDWLKHFGYHFNWRYPGIERYQQSGGDCRVCYVHQHARFSGKCNWLGGQHDTASICIAKKAERIFRYKTSHNR